MVLASLFCCPKKKLSQSSKKNSGRPKVEVWINIRTPWGTLHTEHEPKNKTQCIIQTTFMNMCLTGNFDSPFWKSWLHFCNTEAYCWQRGRWTVIFWGVGQLPCQHSVYSCQLKTFDRSNTGHLYSPKQKSSIFRSDRTPYIIFPVLYFNQMR